MITIGAAGVMQMGLDCCCICVYDMLACQLTNMGQHSQPQAQRLRVFGDHVEVYLVADETVMHVRLMLPPSLL